MISVPHGTLPNNSFRSQPAQQRGYELRFYLGHQTAVASCWVNEIRDKGSRTISEFSKANTLHKPSERSFCIGLKVSSQP